MKLSHANEIELNDVEMPGAVGCKVRWLVGKTDGADNFSMRQFELDVDGFTPKHNHSFEHEIFVLEGEGTVLEGEIAFLIVFGLDPATHRRRRVAVYPQFCLLQIGN